ncbi:hypothetical protein Ahy_B10g105646 isoform A [Arachis hypogaea]|uniref:Uncharacterized protein n=1 Tax=Arachis hypogaea TaxID=3818 RepID=A0A444X8H2_ARAHY|nr:hypothetical protein Ahy_B10g105646 isoform A [Arachis hypogaea]
MRGSTPLYSHSLSLALCTHSQSHSTKPRAGGEPTFSQHLPAPAKPFLPPPRSAAEPFLPGSQHLLADSTTQPQPAPPSWSRGRGHYTTQHHPAASSAPPPAPPTGPIWPPAAQYSTDHPATDSSQIWSPNLRVRYRMHPEICKSSSVFYKNFSSLTTENKTLPLIHSIVKFVPFSHF